MNKEKKWMVTLHDEEYRWLKEMVDSVKLHGSDIIRELIAWTSKENSDKFTEALMNKRTQLLLEELENKKAAIEEEIQQLAGKNGIRNGK